MLVYITSSDHFVRSRVERQRQSVNGSHRFEVSVLRKACAKTTWMYCKTLIIWPLPAAHHAGRKTTPSRFVEVSLRGLLMQSAVLSSTPSAHASTSSASSASSALCTPPPREAVTLLSALIVQNRAEMCECQRERPDELSTPLLGLTDLLWIASPLRLRLRPGLIHRHWCLQQPTQLLSAWLLPSHHQFLPPRPFQPQLLQHP